MWGSPLLPLLGTSLSPSSFIPWRKHLDGGKVKGMLGVPGMSWQLNQLFMLLELSTVTGAGKQQVREFPCCSNKSLELLQSACRSPCPFKLLHRSYNELNLRPHVPQTRLCESLRVNQCKVMMPTTNEPEREKASVEFLQVGARLQVSYSCIRECLWKVPAVLRSRNLANEDLEKWPNLGMEWSTASKNRNQLFQKTLYQVSSVVLRRFWEETVDVKVMCAIFLHISFAPLLEPWEKSVQGLFDGWWVPFHHFSSNRNPVVGFVIS